MSRLNGKLKHHKYRATNSSIRAREDEGSYWYEQQDEIVYGRMYKLRYSRRGVYNLTHLGESKKMFFSGKKGLDELVAYLKTQAEVMGVVSQTPLIINANSVGKKTKKRLENIANVVVKG